MRTITHSADSGHAYIRQQATGARIGGAGGGDAISWFSPTRGTVAVETTEAGCTALSGVLLGELFVL